MDASGDITQKTFSLEMEMFRCRRRFVNILEHFSEIYKTHTHSVGHQQNEMIDYDVGKIYLTSN